MPFIFGYKEEIFKGLLAYKGVAKHLVMWSGQVKHTFVPYSKESSY